MHDQAVKIQADERRRAERKLRHLQDDFRYALKKMSSPLDLNMTYEDVRIYPRYKLLPSYSHNSKQAVPLIKDLPEYKALEDEEGRRAAFAKFVKRQKACTV